MMTRFISLIETTMNKQTVLYLVTGFVLVTGVGVAMITHEAPVTIRSDALLVQMTAADLRKESDLAIVGTVIDTTSYRAASKIRPGKEDILTDATVSVGEFILNPQYISSTTIQVRALGGSVGDSSMTVEDAPVFHKGDKFFAFLRQAEPGVFEVVGWAQGKYGIDANGNLGVGRERIFVRDVFGHDMTLDELRRVLAN